MSEKRYSWLPKRHAILSWNLVGLPRGRSKFASVASRVRVRFTSLPRGFHSSNGPGDDGRSAGALTPACKSSSGPALPASAIQKKSFFCVVTPRPSPAGSRPCLAAPFPPLRRLSCASHALPSFPRFFFSLRPPSSSLGLPFRAPFFPGTSLSTRLTPPLVVYLESSIMCT